MVAADDWTPGRILPPREPRTIPVSIRMPRELYEQLGLYSKRVGAARTYLIVECLRRMLAANGIKKPARGARARARSRAPRAKK
jgi:hypothetical protein